MSVVDIHVKRCDVMRDIDGPRKGTTTCGNGSVCERQRKCVEGGRAASRRAETLPMRPFRRERLDQPQRVHGILGVGDADMSMQERCGRLD